MIRVSRSPGKPEGTEQPRCNTEAQFANSPALDDELLTAIIDALEANQTMSRQALASAQVRASLKSILLGPAQLYEALRSRAGAPESGAARETA